MISIYSRTYSFTDKFFRLVKYALKIVQKGKTKGNVLKMNSAWIGRNHKQQNNKIFGTQRFTALRIQKYQEHSIPNFRRRTSRGKRRWKLEQDSSSLK